MARSITVFEVLYHDDSPASAYAGAAGDGSFIYRTRSEKDALAFAAGKLCCGRPATVQRVDDVPRRLAQRWGMA